VSAAGAMRDVDLKVSANSVTCTASFDNMEYAVRFGESLRFVDSPCNAQLVARIARIEAT
jgi:hypothetical protein